MAGNTLTLDFAGDATKLQRAAKQAQGELDDVGKAAKGAGDDFQKSSKDSGAFLDKIGKLGAGVSGMTDALDTAGGALQAVSDLQQSGAENASRMARAQLDVESAVQDGREAARDLAQSQRDLTRAQLDGKQAAIDLSGAQTSVKRAQLDVEKAQSDLTEAIKEHGKNSYEARDAAIALEEAQNGVKQANQDVASAQEDARQATEDGKVATEDGRRALLDAREAQLNVNDAMREANPSGLQKWADKIQLLTPLLSAVVGVVGLVTAAQWAWNAAQAASPTTWIVLGIVALIAVIVLIVTHLDTVKKVWGAVWNWIKDAAAAVGSWFKDTLWGKWIKGAWNAILDKGSSVVGWFKKIPGLIKSAFSGLVDIISWPYRTAFNLISTAWNNTIGRLSWSIPSWVPGIGGASIAAPQLPKFHTGGVVPGPAGSEMLAVLQAGETVTPAGKSSGGGTVYIRGDGVVDALIEAIAGVVRRRGGDPGTLGIGHA